MTFDPRTLTIIEQGCVVKGNMSCYALRLLGRGEGDVEVETFADIEQGAEITGELKAGSLRMGLGAKVGSFALLNKNHGKRG